jgi:hypothetical protein
MRAGGRRIGLAAASLLLASVAAVAQTQPTVQGDWRIGASAGAYAPLSSIIVGSDSNDTRLGSSAVFGFEVQYLAGTSVAIYGSGMFSFPAIRLGSSIQPGVVGPSTQVTLAGGTAGIVLTTTGWMKGHFQPTLRLGGGFKWYGFDLTGAESHFSPTADLGLGFRGVGSGPIEVTAEVRYLLSAFDQSKLPIRGIVAQDQRQNDLALTIGIGIRP